MDLKKKWISRYIWALLGYDSMTPDGEIASGNPTGGYRIWSGELLVNPVHLLDVSDVRKWRKYDPSVLIQEEEQTPQY